MTYRLRMLGATLSITAMAMIAGCSQDLTFENPNSPDIQRANANPGDVQSIAISSVQSWYTGSTAADPWIMLNVTGDLETMNFGNFGARFNNLEPRIAYANSAANNDAEVAHNPWVNQYATLGMANDVLRAVAGGLELPGGTDKYKALALWSQAGALMQLALIYDKSFAVDETFDVTKGAPEMAPYKDVAAKALAKLDALIALTSGKAWTYTSDEFPAVGGLTATRLNRFANTMAAQLLTYTPRTAAEAAQVDWPKVLQYADKGIGTGSAGAPFDFVVIGEGNFWWSEFMGYFDLPGWMMVDQALIHQMAPNVPAKFDGTIVAPTAPHDARLQIDFSNDADTSGADYVYKGSVVGDASRGVYMQSPFYHERYISVSWQADNSFVGPMPYTLAAENDLIKAEALIRTNGDRALAAQLVNKTRVGRGELTPLTSADGDAAFMQAITYEREVELNATNGFGFFALRHVDQLQPGTVIQLPIPASELETLSLPVYTFGGVGGPVANLMPTTASEAAAALLSPPTSKRLELPSGRVMELHQPTLRRAPQRPNAR